MLSTREVTLALDGAAAVGFATELLTLKEIILLFGDNFGLEASSCSTPELCFKRQNVSS